MEFDDIVIHFNILDAMKHPAEDHSVFHVSVLDELYDEYFPEFLNEYDSSCLTLYNSVDDDIVDADDNYVDNDVVCIDSVGDKSVDNVTVCDDVDKDADFVDVYAEGHDEPDRLGAPVALHDLKSECTHHVLASTLASDLPVEV